MDSFSWLVDCERLLSIHHLINVHQRTGPQRYRSIVHLNCLTDSNTFELIDWLAYIWTHHKICNECAYNTEYDVNQVFLKCITDLKRDIVVFHYCITEFWRKLFYQNKGSKLTFYIYISELKYSKKNRNKAKVKKERVIRVKEQEPFWDYKRVYLLFKRKEATCILAGGIVYLLSLTKEVVIDFFINCFL